MTADVENSVRGPILDKLPSEWKDEGNQKFKEGEYGPAVECYTKALSSCQVENQTEKAVFFKNRAQAYFKLSEFEKCHQDCSEALTLAPGDSKALFRRATASEKLGKLDDAYRDAKQALALEPDNAAIKTLMQAFYRGDIVSTHLAVDVKLMAVNYFGQVALCKALLPGMIAQGGGSIVVIGSVQGKIALPHRSCYAASKHALQAFCDSMRAETSSRNVFVTVVNPGYVRTGLSENAMTADGSKYGSMDSTTANGMSPDSVAKRTIKAIILREKEVTVSGIAPKAATWLRSVLPSLYFFIMEFRAGVRKQIDDDLAKTD
ncbi:unnamed protein product [Notodromas monacha]|uniref:Uncharacterized protein n=1 Tax=Notodromas monacha TaxID=399045 RepID=A0A7R9C0F3_9CRUS|nr:unnamed protein product [Notodromas monacha]CAG0924020.1 unnamed protein product [Notodromas monacha]